MTIAQNSYGSVRLAIQYLQRCIKGQLYTKEDIESELNIISEEKEYQIIYDLLDKKPDGLWALQGLKDLKTFFLRSRAMLVGASVYKITNRVDADWKEKNASFISKKENLISLLECYTDIYNNYIFNNDQFIYNLIKYYNVKVRVRNS